MMPAPPPDPVLPALPEALDPDAAAGLLERALGLGIRTAQPDWVTYRPGHSCLVRYRIDSGPGIAHAVLAPERRLARLWSRAGVPPSGGGLPDRGLIAFAYPADLRLPALTEAASPGGMLALLNGLPGLERARRCRPQLVRYKPGRRAVLRCELDGAPAVYAKLRSDDRGRHIVRTGRALCELGVGTPAPLGYLPQARMTVHAEAEGARLKDLRGSDRYAGWMEPAVEALCRLHDAVPVAPARWSPAQDAAELLAAGDRVGALLPRLAAGARRLAERLAGSIIAGGGAAVPCHGSFHDDQLLVGESGVTLLDLDSVALADPLLDVGHFAAYLSAEGQEAEREVFLEAYARRAGRRLAGAQPFEAASLLRWSTLPFREARPDWPELVERRVRLAEQRLGEHRAAVAAPVPAPGPG